MSQNYKSSISRWRTLCCVDSDLAAEIRYVMVISETEALFITEKDEVYGVGANSNGCLGVGEGVTMVSGQPARVDSLCGKKIISIVSSYQPHLMAVSEDGDLYVWGDNSYGQLGIGNTNRVYTPKLCMDLQTYSIQQVACGYYHSLMLTKTGEIFSCGHNNYWQLGTNLANTVSQPLLVNGLPKSRSVKSIMCTALSSYALMDGGQLFGWGYNSNGELGNHTTEQSWSPKRVGIHEDYTFTSASCGHAHVLGLSHGGCIYAWGINSYGQLGIGHSTSALVPTHIEVPGVLFIEVGAHFKLHISTAVTNKGEVYVWGQLKNRNELKPRSTNFSSVHDAFVTLATETVMFKPLKPLEEVESQSSIQQCLETHLNNNEFSDVTFRFGKQKLFGHASFLRMRSDYFRELLRSVSDEREIVINHCSYDVFYAYLQYLYTGELHIDAAGALELLRVTDNYHEKALKQKCLTIVMTETSVENVFEFYAASTKLMTKDLENFCRKFAVLNLNAATQTDAYRSLDDAIAKEFLLTAGTQNSFRN